MEKVSDNPLYSSKNINPARAAAVRILNKVERSGSYIDKLVDFELRSQNLSPEDKGLLQELVYGVTRWKAKLDWVLIGFFHGDFQKCFNYVKNAMRVALYQVLFLDRIPAPAAIDESVEMVKKKQGRKTAGLVNGVLRNISRNIDYIRYPKENEDRAFYLSVMESHPKWMVERWIERYGEDETVQLMKLNNQIPHYNIRVNENKVSVSEITETLKGHEVNFEISKYLPNSIKINSRDIKIPNTELFKSGKITVQDTSASLVCKLANPSKGAQVLDTCAAPGGKSLLLAEMVGDEGHVRAIDKFEARIGMMNNSIERMGYKNITTEISDIRKFNSEETYDLVIVDAPCSGLGTLSKKPDIKWTTEKEDLRRMKRLQIELLQEASKFVKDGGVLVYSTCTIEPEENDMVIEKFLSNNSNFEIDPAQNYLSEELCDNNFLKTLPQKHGMDGAFGARLIKKA